MVSVGDYNPGIIRPHWNHHRLRICKWIDFTAIHDGLYSQETKQHLVLSLQNNMIRGSNSLLF